MPDIKELVQGRRDAIVGARRALHRIPEPAYTEEKTSAYVAAQLRGLGLPVREKIARYGVVATMDTGKPGPCLLIRADMDALPVVEQTGLDFASEHEGAMHACGHDAHMAMVLGAAMCLGRLKDSLTGVVKFLFQPAEEGPGGAKPMIEEGVMEDPVVDYSLGAHVWHALPEGTVGVKAGPLMAAMDRFDLKILGKGGHGAMPHQCVDALDVGVQVVDALQRLVSRKSNPLQPAVVTVGAFHAGTTFNVIPGEAEMCGTTRTFDRAVWETWPGRVEEVVAGVCASMGAQYELTYTQGYPPLHNDAEMAGIMARLAADVVGADRVREPEPTMGGEDMSFFFERSKGCFVFLGVGREGGYPIHNPRFDFDEKVLLTGVELYCRAALELLG